MRGGPQLWEEALARVTRPFPSLVIEWHALVQGTAFDTDTLGVLILRHRPLYPLSILCPPWPLAQMQGV